MSTADALIERLGLRPHPEGGHYAETHRDRPADGSRGALTCIYFLLKAGELSAWHRIDATEVWHHQAGAPLALTLAPPDGRGAQAHRLGPDVLGGQHPHVVVPPHWWQTAETLGGWTLASCTVAPAFSFDGFELAPPDWRPTPR